MWLEEKELSEWAYRHCMFREDKTKVRKLITDSHWADTYCLYVKNRPEVRKYIKEK